MKETLNSFSESLHIFLEMEGMNNLQQSLRPHSNRLKHFAATDGTINLKLVSPTTKQSIKTFCGNGWNDQFAACVSDHASTKQLLTPNKHPSCLSSPWKHHIPYSRRGRERNVNSTTARIIDPSTDIPTLLIDTSLTRCV